MTTSPTAAELSNGAVIVGVVAGGAVSARAGAAVNPQDPTKIAIARKRPVTPPRLIAAPSPTIERSIEVFRHFNFWPGSEHSQPTRRKWSNLVERELVYFRQIHDPRLLRENVSSWYSPETNPPGGRRSLSARPSSRRGVSTVRSGHRPRRRVRRGLGHRESRAPPGGRLAKPLPSSSCLRRPLRGHMPGCTASSSSPSRSPSSCSASAPAAAERRRLRRPPRQPRRR